MSGKRKPAVRKPATKFAHLQKKKAKQSTSQVQRAGKKQQRGCKP